MGELAVPRSPLATCVSQALGTAELGSCLTYCIWSFSGRVCRMDGWMERQMDKQRCEGEKGREPLSQCLAPPEEEGKQKAGGSPPTHLLCLLRRPPLSGS